MNHLKFELLDEKITTTMMQSGDFEEINQWCIEEGWNIGLQDSELYYKIDPKGHYIAQSTKRLASLSLIKHSSSFFTLGPFIVHKAYRGQGLGEALWNEAMARMKQESAEALISLYAVAAQVSRYKKAGFFPVLNIQRWYLNAQAQPPINTECNLITKELLPELCAYYQKKYSMNRELLFSQLLTQKECKGLAFIDKQHLKGFGFIRPCIRGFRMGVLVSDSPEIAQQLVAELLVFAKNAPVFIDVPASNLDSQHCMQAFTGERAPSEDTVMMIKGEGYSKYLEQWGQHYGLFSLEIG